MLIGSYPYKGTNERELLASINEDHIEFPEYISDEAKSLIRRLL